jgi:hypothetical protein
MADIQFPAGLGGTFGAVVEDNNGAPANVLEAAAPIKVKARWRLNPATAAVLGGEWRVSTYYESMGAGGEGTLFTSRPIPVDGRTTPYEHEETVRAGFFPNDPAPGTGGIYKLVTVLLLINHNRVTNVAAVVEGPVVRIG